MKDVSRRFLESLIHAISPSGYEEEAARVWQAEARGFAAAVRHDVHGNSHAVINPGGAPRVLLAGHCDEIGFVVSHIDDHGFLWIQPIGGWDPQIPQGHRVLIRGRKGRVPGVIGKMPIHLLKAEEREKVTKLDRLWVDIGAGSRKEAEKRVAVGDPLVLDHDLAELNGRILAGRGFDNRIGAFIVLEVLRHLAKSKLKAEVHAVATVQEEIGIRGARTAAFGIDPQIGIATDVTFATDHPTMEEAVRRFGNIKLGGGPVLSRGPNVHPRLFERFVETAEKRKIRHQIEAHGGATPTDANLIQVSRAGVITALVSTPCRYLHSSCELIHLDDVEAEIELIAETVAGLKPDTDFSLLR